MHFDWVTAIVMALLAVGLALGWGYLNRSRLRILLGKFLNQSRNYTQVIEAKSTAHSGTIEVALAQPLRNQFNCLVSAVFKPMGGDPVDLFKFALTGLPEVLFEDVVNRATIAAEVQTVNFDGVFRPQIALTTVDETGYTPIDSLWVPSEGNCVRLVREGRGQEHWYTDSLLYGLSVFLFELKKGRKSCTIK